MGSDANPRELVSKVSCITGHPGDVQRSGELFVGTTPLVSEVLGVK